MAYATIRIERGTQTAGDGREIQETQGRAQANQPRVASVSIFTNLAVNQARQVMSYAVGNIGNFTGDYLLQQQVQQAVGLIGDATTIAGGFIAGGPIGGAVAVVGVASKYALQAVSYTIEQEKLMIQTNFLTQRSGNSTNNGSR